MKKILAMLVILLCSCSQTRYTYDFDYSNSNISSKDYSLSLSIINGATNTYNSMNAYMIIIDNKTKSPIEVDWNRTLFIYNGSTNRGFMFEGVVYSKRDENKTPTIILAGQRYYQRIYPNALANYRRVGNSGFWNNETIPDGKTGVFLTMKVNGKEINETITIEKTTRIINN